MSSAPEGDSLVDIPLDAEKPEPSSGESATPASPKDNDNGGGPSPKSPAGPVRGEIVAGEEPEEAEEAEKEAPVEAPARTSSKLEESAPSSGAPRVARARKNSEEMRSERERLERHQQQRKLMVTHNKNVRETLVNQLLGRLMTGKAVCEDLLGYLKAQASADADFATHNRQAAELLEGKTRQRVEIGTVRRCLEALWGSSAGASTHMGSIGDFAKTDSMRRLQQLIQDLEARIKTVKEDSTKATKTLNQNIEKVSSLYKDYQQAATASTSGKEVENDPYIAGIQYHAALADLKDVDRAYGESLSALLQEVDRLDRQRIDTVKAIAGDYLQARIRALEGVIGGLRDAAAAVDTMTGDDFLAFSLTTQRDIAAMKENADLAPYNFDVATLDSDGLRAQCNQLPSLLDTTADALHPCDVPIEHDFAEDVVREGWLKKKGGLLKPGKPIYVQLTRNGFLHFFASKGGCVPDTSVALLKCEVETEKDEHTFCVQVKRIGMQVLGKEKHHLTADSQDVMVEWICAIKDCAQVV